MASSRHSRLMYVYDMPYVHRKGLCTILDQDDKWEELGGRFMEYDVPTLELIRKSKSPTDQLLRKWGEQNHSVLELFILLSQMRSYRAMLEIKPLVDMEYHELIENGEENLLKIFAKLEMRNSPGPSAMPQTPVENGNGHLTESKKDMKIGTCNVNSPDKDEKEETIRVKVVLPPMESEVENNSPSKLQETIIRKEIKKDNGPLENNEHRHPPENKENGLPVEIPVAPTESKRKLSNASTISSSIETCTPLINYSELEVATNGWDKNLIVGRGGFGVVYKGSWKNTQVAIKKLESQDAASDEFVLAQQQQSLREIKYLNQFRHDNILPLYGYSFGGDSPCLVYQFMDNGSLEDRLQCRRGSKPLNWPLRCSIATGVARGLQFLHYRNSPFSSKPLIHGDIKSANILLDPSCVPKIGDFGLAREGPPEDKTHLTISRVHGTRPYLPVDFLRNKKFSTKVDTYSFGIVLFEIATGLRACEESRPKKFLVDYVRTFDQVRLVELADAKAGIDSTGVAPGLFSTGMKCVMERAHLRPEMEVVLGQLNELTGMMARYHQSPKPTLESPTSPYNIQRFYDQLSEQRRSSIPNSTAMAVGTAGSVVVQQLSPQPVSPLMVPPVFPGPHISITPPSVGAMQLQNSHNTPVQEPSRDRTGSSSYVSPYVTSPADDLPLLSELGVLTHN